MRPKRDLCGVYVSRYLECRLKNSEVGGLRRTIRIEDRFLGFGHPCSTLCLVIVAHVA